MPELALELEGLCVRNYLSAKLLCELRDNPPQHGKRIFLRDLCSRQANVEDAFLGLDVVILEARKWDNVRPSLEDRRAVGTFHCPGWWWIRASDL